MAYIGTKPANQVIDSTLIADGTVTPSDLSTGKPYWDASGNFGIGTTTLGTYGKFQVSNGTNQLAVSFSSNNPVITATNNAGNAYTNLLFDGTTQQFYTNGAERMRIDSSGRVTMPNQPAFHAQVSEGATVSSNTYIVFGTVRVNKGSHYNSSNGRFTAPVSGLYLFYISAINESNNSVSRFTLHINGSIAYGGSQSTQLRLDATASGGEIVDGSKQAILNLTAGDFVQVKYDHDTGSNMNYPDWTNFGGHLLG